MKSMWTINPDMASARVKQAGFSVPAALFIVLVLAGLAAFLVTIGSGQQLGHAQDVVGSRVLQAARTGTEWGIRQILSESTGTFQTNCASGGSSAVLNNLSGLEGLRIQVQCSSVNYPNGDPPLRSYLITSVACNDTTSCGAGAHNQFYVERRIETNITN